MRERHLYIRKKKAARKPLCDDRCDAVAYFEELGELLLPLLPGVVLGVVDCSEGVFFCFCVFFLLLVVVSPEEPDVFTPDVSVALGDEPLVTLLLSPAAPLDEPEESAAPPMDEPDEPDGPPMDEPEDPDAPPMDEPEEPDVPEDPEELPLVPVSLCDFIGED